MKVDAIESIPDTLQPKERDGISTGALPRTGGKAVFLTHSPFASPFRVGSHQLAVTLGRMGWDVLHIPTPFTPAHLVRAPFDPTYRHRAGHLFRTFRMIEPGVTEYIPLALVPWQLVKRNPERAPEAYARSQWGAQHRIARHGFSTPDLLFIDEPRFVAMAKWFKPRRSFYRATDLYHKMKGDASVLVAERRALQETDGFIATSAPVYDHLRKMAPDKPGLVVENGVELDHFVRPAPIPADLEKIPAPRALYVGAIDDRFDFPAVIALARLRPGVSFVLVGPGKAGGGESSLPANVHLLGARPYEMIPAYMQHSTLGLLPLTNHPANQGRSPMKIYEYGAAGLPILASKTEEMARRNLGFVSLYESTEEMAQGLDVTLATRSMLSPRAIKAAQAMSWKSRLHEIMEFSDNLG